MASPYNSKISITTALIIINIAVFLLGWVASVPALFGLPYPSSPTTEPITVGRGAYSWFTCFMEGEGWRLITYQFLHSGVFHLVFNMWALHFFGPVVEDAMGSNRFLAFYLACGVAGALFSSLLAGLGFFSSGVAGPALTILLQSIAAYTGYDHIELWQLTPMVGASAAVYGVLVAVAFLYPHSRISLLFPPVVMTLRTFALIILGISIITVLMNGENAGGEAGHLGGIILAAIIMFIWKYRYIRQRNNDRTF